MVSDSGAQDRLIRWGLGCTAAWALAVPFYAFLPCISETCERMSPGVLGDFLAGFLSPVAFLWFVVAVFIQREELRQNSEALRLQAKELRQQVEQSTRLAEEAIAARGREEYRAQPLLIFTGGKIQQGKVFRNVKNQGAPVTHLRASTGDPNLNLRLPPDFLGSEQVGRIEWLVTGPPGPFMITYRDALGEVRTQRYEISDDLNRLILSVQGEHEGADHPSGEEGS